MTLEELKQSARYKRYDDPVPNLVFHGDYLLTYCFENMKKVLAISRKDRERFDDPDLPEVKKVFGDFKDAEYATSNVFPQRGYTIMYTLGWV